MGGFVDMRLGDGVTSLLELFEVWEDIGVERIAGWAYLAWSTWYRRNQLVFEGLVNANGELVVRAGKMKARLTMLVTHLASTGFLEEVG